MQFQLESNLSFGGVYWHDESIFTKVQVAEILEIDVRNY